MDTSPNKLLLDLYNSKQFEFHSSDVFFDTMMQICRSFPPTIELYFANGSFGDHYIFGSLLNELKKQFPMRNFRVFTNPHYSELYKSFLLESHLVVLPDQVCNIIAGYFRTSLDWLKTDYTIKPLLGVYYPLIPSMVTQQGSVKYIDYIYRILKISPNESLAAQSDLIDRKAEIARKKLYFNDIGNPQLLFFPSSQTLRDIPITFWRCVFDKLTAKSFSIVVAKPHNSKIDLSTPWEVSVTPEDLVPLADLSSLIIGAANGALHTIRLFSTNPTITVVENANQQYAFAKDGRAICLNHLSVDTYGDLYKTKSLVIDYDYTKSDECLAVSLVQTIESVILPQNQGD